MKTRSHYPEYVALASLLVGSALALACSAPVFRVALLDPRWRPERYELYVVHDGPLGDADRAALREWNDYLDRQEGRVNAGLEVVDVAKNPTAELIGELSIRVPLSQPLLIVRYPAATGIKRPLWSGPLAQAPLRELFDSPQRQEIGKRLLAGETAVWVLIESGDPARDGAAHAILKEQVRKLETTLALPEPKPGDEDKWSRDGAPPLRLAFSLVRLARTDPAERWLVESFLGMEEDLRGRDEPIVFPVFGRGIALYALVGKGINADTIAQAAGFVVGACSCEVRRQNPGIDLLMTADWENGSSVPSLAVLSDQPPPEPAVPSPRGDGGLFINTLVGSVLGLAVATGVGMVLLLRGKGVTAR